MSRLFKTSSAEQFPAWIDENSEIKKLAEQMSPDDIARLSSKEIDETQEFDLIEKCASSKAPYYYGASWDKELKSRVQEYAYINDCKAIAIDLNSEKMAAYTSSKTSMQKEASVEVAAPLIPFELIDAFHLDEKGNDSHMKKVEWEKVTSSDKLAGVTPQNMTVLRSSGIIEDNNLSPHLRVRDGQNSVTDPDAIGKLANSEVEDNGVRLKRENAEHQEQRKLAKSEWEADAKKSASDIGFGALSLPTIKKTESAHCSSGIRSTQPVIDAKSMPEKTDGEILRDTNIQRKANIQRSKREDRSWDALENQHQAGMSINDLFAEELKNRMSSKKA